ncbi:hypothetical protein C7S18_01965 [Ahniella affigens]|uniref:Uncharacterized protein n=1 Tax=Ahniella affigens TaxID=2021234 RepID=A0A2P1PMH5_9GAMM|nr:hypothetical protein [Ahniella affigens]AVP96032.1 hypothetical protein C7S18_01965 [Ahniella affigens]
MPLWNTFWSSLPPSRRWFLGFMLLVLALGWLGAVDRLSATYLDRVLERTLTAFALARGTNAAISLLQDADLTVTPVGVGVTLSPGELLDPVNDLVEQVSSFLLVAATSLGIQRIVLEVAGAHLMQWVLSILFLLGLPAWLGTRHAGLALWPARLFLSLLLLRWLLPLQLMGMQAIDVGILEPRYQAAVAELTLSKQQAEAVGQWADTAEPADPSLAERLQRLWPGSNGQAWQDRIQGLASQLSQMTRSLVELLVVFALQSLVLPLAFVWLSGVLLRAIVRWSFLSPKST